MLITIVLLVSFTATSSSFPFLSLLILLVLVFSSAQLVYAAISWHKSKLATDSHRGEHLTFKLDGIVLTVSTLNTGEGEIIFVEISIAFAFIQFIIIVSLVKIFLVRIATARVKGREEKWPSLNTLRTYSSVPQEYSDLVP